MIRLKTPSIQSLDDAFTMLQMAVELEFGTLPPYLYALYSIPPGENDTAYGLIKSVAMEEMIHMCLACNIMNALGRTPQINPPTYPGPLPGGIGPDGQPLIIHLYPFSQEAMKQAMDIEEPEDGGIPFPHEALLATAQQEYVSIGQFYTALDQFLSTLPASAWQAGRNQLDDSQFLQGQIFPVNNYADASRAIGQIISEGEGTPKTPLDFEGEVAHYYRFGEIYYNQVLTQADNPMGYAWTGTLGIDWSAVYPAITDPGEHDFSQDPPAAQAAQEACDAAFTAMVQGLQQAVSGETGFLGIAVRSMFDLRMAARKAMTVPLADSTKVAGPSFRVFS